MEIKVGDRVRITDPGEQYTTYWTWPGAREMHTGRGTENNSARWRWAHYILQDMTLDSGVTLSTAEFVVKWKAKHEDQDRMLYLLEEVKSGYPVLIGESGIKLDMPVLNDRCAFKYKGYTFYLCECAAANITSLSCVNVYVCFAHTNHSPVNADDYMVDIVPGFWSFNTISDLDVGAQVQPQVLAACDEFISRHPDWLGDPE